MPSTTAPTMKAPRPASTLPDPAPGLAARHRGSRLSTGPEPSGKAIRCPYHGWTDHLDGKLVGAPEGTTIPCLDRPSLGLFPARVDRFLGLLFVNLDAGATRLRELLPGSEDLVGRYLGPDLETDRRIWRYLQRGISTPGWDPGPLSRREAGVPWFAGRVRGDLARYLGETPDRGETSDRGETPDRHEAPTHTGDAA